MRREDKWTLGYTEFDTKFTGKQKKIVSIGGPVAECIYVVVLFLSFGLLTRHMELIVFGIPFMIVFIAIKTFSAKCSDTDIKHLRKKNRR